MSLHHFAARYDAFQSIAVDNITRDFDNKPHGRFLLVIPTGGGKTFVAVKAVNRLFEKGVLNADSDTVFWTAHRTELLDQARATFTMYVKQYARRSYVDRVVFGMISNIKERLAHNGAIKLTVIDEAHHGAANSYQPIFENKNIGILGLTATPSRHDGLPLEFERESYSIGFPDLVKKGVILKPTVRTIESDRFELTSFDDDELERLNNPIRNQRIIDELTKHHGDYNKVIIYVGTTAHVHTLYRTLCESPLRNLYESISYITGDGNSRNEERAAFIKAEKLFTRSILVNVRMLNEGYDDPSVNTVVMATPTRSKLYYMQAMGRCIRHNPDEPLKRAFIIEIADDLPNIRYRIDNRWLYADVSDALEPAVVDRDFASAGDFVEKLNGLYDEFDVPIAFRTMPVFDLNERYSLLLFKKYVSVNKYVGYPILIHGDNRLAVSNMFNFLSERMGSYKKRDMNSEAAFRMLGSDVMDLISQQENRSWIYHALENSVPVEEGVTDEPDFVSSGRPWITFVAFHYRRAKEELPSELLEFLDHMVNRDEILEAIETRNYDSGACLVKLPLPLGWFVGRIVTKAELEVLSAIITKIRALEDEQGQEDHTAGLQAILSRAVLPFEQAYTGSLALIVRDDMHFTYLLD